MNKGDLIVAMTEQGEGLLASTAIVPESKKYLHNQRIGLILANGNANKTFLYYLFNSEFVRKQIRGSSSGTKVRHTSPERIYNVKISIPEIAIQAKIAAVLSAYDDLIENNRRRIGLLEKTAEEIYREWFVRMRFPGYQNAEFEKGVSEGWEKKRFADFCLLQRGYDLPDSKIEIGDYPVIASTSIKAFHKEYKVNPPVITTGRSGSLGTVLFVNQPAFPLNTALFVKDFYGNSPFLIYYTLKNMKLENFNAGAGVPSLNRNHLAGLSLAVPNKELQYKFDDIIAPIFARIESLTKAKDILEKTKSLLLPRLISGKLSVENLDIQFPPQMTVDETGLAAQ